MDYGHEEYGLHDEEYNFSTRAGIPSDPEDFVIPRFASTLLTSLVRIWTTDTKNMDYMAKNIILIL